MLVLSPHLDDAVLSAWHAIRQGASVLTIFAGAPDRAAPLPAWDRLCGFSSAHEAMRARWREDDTALAGVTHARLDYLDHQSRSDALDAETLAGALAPLLAGETAVYAPVAVAPRPHPDHVLVTEAALLLRESYGELRLYGDLPHILRGEGVWPRAIEPGETEAPAYWSVIGERPVTSRWPVVERLDRDAAAEKATMMRAYRSQFYGLTTAIRSPGRGVLRNPAAYGVEAWWPGRTDGPP